MSGTMVNGSPVNEKYQVPGIQAVGGCLRLVPVSQKAAAGLFGRLLIHRRCEVFFSVCY